MIQKIPQSDLQQQTNGGDFRTETRQAIIRPVTVRSPWMESMKAHERKRSTKAALFDQNCHCRECGREMSLLGGRPDSACLDGDHLICQSCEDSRTPIVPQPSFPIPVVRSLPWQRRRSVRQPDPRIAIRSTEIITNFNQRERGIKDLGGSTHCAECGRPINNRLACKHHLFQVMAKLLRRSA